MQLYDNFLYNEAKILEELLLLNNKTVYIFSSIVFYLRSLNYKPLRKSYASLNPNILKGNVTENAGP